MKKEYSSKYLWRIKCNNKPSKEIKILRNWEWKNLIEANLIMNKRLFDLERMLGIIRSKRKFKILMKMIKLEEQSYRRLKK